MCRRPLGEPPDTARRLRTVGARELCSSTASARSSLTRFSFNASMTCWISIRRAVYQRRFFCDPCSFAINRQRGACHLRRDRVWEEESSSQTMSEPSSLTFDVRHLCSGLRGRVNMRRKRNCEGRTLAGRAIHLNFPAVLADDSERAG